MSELNLNPMVVSGLEQVRRTLTLELNFDVTLEQTIQWMLKKQGVTLVQNGKGMIALPEGITPSDINHIATLMRATQKIDAIKFVRMKTNMGLKEAKDFVEENFQYLYDEARRY